MLPDLLPECLAQRRSIRCRRGPVRSETSTRTVRRRGAGRPQRRVSRETDLARVGTLEGTSSPPTACCAVLTNGEAHRRESTMVLVTALAVILGPGGFNAGSCFNSCDRKAAIHCIVSIEYGDVAMTITKTNSQEAGRVALRQPCVASSWSQHSEATCLCQHLQDGVGLRLDL